MLPELVELLSRHTAGPENRDRLYFQILKNETLMQHLEALTDLLAYLLAGAAPSSDWHLVVGIVDKLLASGVPKAKLHALAERLAELGCGEARDRADRIDRP